MYGSVGLDLSSEDGLGACDLRHSLALINGLSCLYGHCLSLSRELSQINGMSWSKL